ncbi:hypothetical protein OUZ56_012991 [Daphnia magna]|uniref:Secreted protein n=1 Tax=Daphnia magna TaxID=35525 RepID=A0ABQ9Z5S9_9CRUS|nr:hypothetical protein OUZ56_012991 [Daphnia magna]
MFFFHLSASVVFARNRKLGNSGFGSDLCVKSVVFALTAFIRFNKFHSYVTNELALTILSQLNYIRESWQALLQQKLLTLL